MLFDGQTIRKKEDMTLTKAESAYWDVQNKLADLLYIAEEYDSEDTQYLSNFNTLLWGLKNVLRMCERLRDNVEKFECTEKDIENLGFLQVDIEDAVSEFEWIVKQLREEIRS